MRGGERIFTDVRPVILVPGRLSATADRVRGLAVGSGRLAHEAVVRAGGQTLVLPPLPGALDGLGRVLGSVDAVMLLGGGDVDPAAYGQDRATETIAGVVAAHDEVEIAVARAAVERDIPVLAICRGCQVLNVALGGTLHQHLGDVLGDGSAHWDSYHSIDLDPGSRIAAAMGTASFASGHSWHHQSVDRLGDGLVATGRAPDGVVEAVEHAGRRWVVGVQWHPEDDAESSAEQQRVFGAFVAAVAR